MIARASHAISLRAADVTDRLLGRADRFTPPRRLRGYVGDSDFRATGEEFAGHFRDLGGLAPGHRVLEIGCGIGRMARALVPVLRPPGSYDGFDIVREGIDWCRAHYVDTPVPFRFVHADLRNSAYNPDGAERAADYRFPFADGAFDFVFATSLFTHVLADAADHYLAEAARVLAPGGRLFTTWLLLSDARRATPPPPFRRLGDTVLPGAVADPEVPEDAVAYDEWWVRETLEVHGFDAVGIHTGTWAGDPGLSHQDLVVARLSPAAP